MKLTWIVLVHKYVQYVGNIETNSHEFSVSPVLKLPNVFFFFFFLFSCLSSYSVFCSLKRDQRASVSWQVAMT